MGGLSYEDLMLLPKDYYAEIIAMINEEWEDWQRDHPGA